MNIIEAVYNSIKNKKAADITVQRLGITIDQYNDIKAEIHRVSNILGDKIASAIVKTVEENLSKPETGSDEKTLSSFSTELKEEDTLKNLIKESESKIGVLEVHENLEEGTSKIVGISATEPRSPAEIIEILKIDTTKWKLSQYWNKEKGTRWVVSAMVTRISAEEKAQSSFLELLSEHTVPVIAPLKKEVKRISESDEKVCGIISLQDLHFGKVGNGDMEKTMMDGVTYLIDKAHRNYHLEKIILVAGPDTLNMDTFNGTTTKGTPVENSEMATEAYIKAFDAIVKAVGLLSQYTENLEVVFIPGNHDRLSSFHLLHAVSQAFKMWKGITFNIDYAERKVINYGKNMLCFEHGDVTAKNNPLIYAVEFPTEWGSSVHRMLYTGHYHGRKTKEFITENEENGFVTRIIPALTGPDYYHYHNKYVGNKRSAILHLHDANNGLVSEFVYNV
jgi:hypothetical protein